jgi:hypothetical protein
VPGPSAFLIWLLCTFAEAAVVVCSLARGSFKKYLALNSYMVACIVVNALRLQVLLSYGYSSREYAYLYYFSDVFLNIGLYFTLTSLYAHVFEEMGAEKSIRLGAIVLLLGTSLCSFAIVVQSGNQIVGRFFVEVSQNLNFVGLVLTYVLWGAIVKLRETRTRLIQLVLSLGIFFSLLAAMFALRNLYPPLHSVLQGLDPIIGCLLPITWAYAFWRFPEDARLTPSRLAMVPR